MSGPVTLSKVLVTAAGVAAIAWVLWYFLAVPGAPRLTRRRPER